MSKIIRYFSESDLRAGHLGLSLTAKKAGVNTAALGQGEFLVFVNRARDKVKMFAGGNVVAYLKMDKGKLDPRVIQHLPRHFNGARINYDGAMRDVLKTSFPEWFKKKGVKK